mmetsp:Transcript_4080/g.4996  ORF Transcript_4080/g.4996 Transcript_4080/m.4996 type:complete len:82 (-) Transcript_4080:148-393(-)
MVDATSSPDHEMTSSDEQIEDDGSSAEEECKTKSLQPLKAALPSTFEKKQTAPRVFVILEAANLETTVTKRGIELINSDEH